MSPLSSQITGTHGVPALPAHIPACWRAVLPPPQLDWCRVSVGSLLPQCAGAALLFPQGSRAGAAYPDHLQGPSGISQLLRNVWGLLEISHCQQVSQAHQAPQYLPSAVARTCLLTGY